MRIILADCRKVARWTGCPSQIYRVAFVICHEEVQRAQTAVRASNVIVRGAVVISAKNITQEISDWDFAQQRLALGRPYN